MGLSSMVISRDAEQISLLECILGGLHIHVEVEPEPRVARTKLEKSRVDALIVDAEVEGSLNFLREMEQQENQNSVPLVIMGPSYHSRKSQAQPASFLFQKPISVKQAVRILLSARNTILERRLHYHRQDVQVPVSVTVAENQFQAQIENLSQGGARIHGPVNLDFALPAQLEFTLPGAGPMTLQANLAWADERGNVGVQFCDVPPASHRSLQLWLEQQYFSP